VAERGSRGRSRDRDSSGRHAGSDGST
jgi:hypothetical protein